MRRGERSIRLAGKHVFFAELVCGNFEAFAHALPAVPFQGVLTSDFAAQPDLFNLCRLCLAHGARIESTAEGFRLRKDNRAMLLSPRHLVYTADIAAKFDMYFSLLVPEQQEDGLLVLDYSRPGKLQRYAGSGLEFEMASFPEEEEAIEEYFRWYRPKAGDLVFDMGAHCGVSTYHMAKLVGPEGKVVCFEPDPTNFEILKRNLARHGLANVEAQAMAIASKSGELAFNAEGTIGSSLSSLLLRESVGRTVTVQAITLAEAFARWGTPAFCKIDIEGAELEVIGGSGETLRACRTHFALDTNHPQADGKMTAEEIETIFRGYGYEAASEANPLLTTWARPQ